jgi:hypothetical protein
MRAAEVDAALRTAAESGVASSWFFSTSNALSGSLLMAAPRRVALSGVMGKGSS